jgi:hypothetical protein
MSEDLRSARRAKALFQALSGDFLLREQFVTDPAGILTEYVHGKALEPESATAANQLLYAVVSNPEMFTWLRQQAGRGGGGGSSSRAMAADFAGAVQRHGDRAIVASLIRCGTGEPGTTAAALDLLKAVASVIGGPIRRLPGDGTEFTPGTGTEFTPGPGTEFTPGTGTGTEVSPGTGTEFTPGTGTGTEVSPGTGTEFTPGTGTEFTPGTGTGTEVSPGTGTGTEVSPGTGTGTEVSPGTGTGTEVSPGTGTGTEVSPGKLPQFGQLEVAVRSLVEFANELRAAGALIETGLA